MLGAQAIDRQTATHERRRAPAGRSSPTTFTLTGTTSTCFVLESARTGSCFTCGAREPWPNTRRLPEMIGEVLSDHGED